MSISEQQAAKIRNQPGFIAALDQSGGSTPKALKLYGVEENTYSGEQQMMDLVHQMRTRIVTSPVFAGNRIAGAILFEATMDREFGGKPAAEYLWNKQVVPFLKIDKGLADEANGVQLMKPMPTLDDLLKKAKSKGIFGTKERSVIKQNNAEGIKAVVAQQFEVAKQVLSHGLVPIVEPEVDIKCPDKAGAEEGAEGRVAGCARQAAGESAGDAEAHDSGSGQPVRGSREAPARAEGGGAVGWLQPR